MQFWRKLTQKKTKKRRADVYQDSLNTLGTEQFKKILEKGLQVPVVLM